MIYFLLYLQNVPCCTPQNMSLDKVLAVGKSELGYSWVLYWRFSQLASINFIFLYLCAFLILFLSFIFSLMFHKSVLLIFKDAKSFLSKEIKVSFLFGVFVFSAYFRFLQVVYFCVCFCLYLLT